MQPAVRSSAYLWIGATLFTGIIVARLAYLQLLQGTQLFVRGQRNCTRIERTVAPRGNIVDCFGRLLATNRPIMSVYWRGTGNRLLTDAQRTVLNELCEQFGIQMPDDVTLMHAERKFQRIELLQDLTVHQLSVIAERWSEHPNILVLTSYQRYYPEGALASHVLGYLGNGGPVTAGKLGLELWCDEVLRGQPGCIMRTINSVGAYLAEHEVARALTGESLVTHIDLDLLHILARVFPADYSGACLVMEARTGAVRALLSRPDFDPNIFVGVLDHHTWHDLQQGNPFMNRVASALYPPASLFKLVTMAAALQEGLVKYDSRWFCGGEVSFGSRAYHCHALEGHGWLTTQEALAKSCNIPLYDIARNLKIDTLADYAHRFGLGKTTGSILPERSGLIPTRSWKRSTYGQPWWPGETLSAAIGQSYLLVTPLQMACMVGAICEGFRVTPRVLVNEPEVKIPLELDDDIRNFLKSSMRQVVRAGTGHRLRMLNNFEIYAKTGTAQTSDLSKREMGMQYREHGWIVAHVSYKQQEPLILLVIVEHAGSSRVATAVALQFLQQYAVLCNQRSTAE